MKKWSTEKITFITLFLLLDSEKNKKKREIFRLKELKTAPAPFLETISLNTMSLQRAYFQMQFFFPLY